MTPIGHSLFGTSVGIMCMPQFKKIRARAVFLTSFAFLAYIPDFPVIGWGHNRYHVSHSLFVNLAIIVIIIVFLSFSKNARGMIGGKYVILGGIIAWLSHFLLDSFYKNNQMIAIFWPFGNGRLALSILWFRTINVSVSLLDPYNIKVYLVEFLFYFPILLVSIFLRKQLFQKSEK